jgi:hypothetical protein
VKNLGDFGFELAGFDRCVHRLDFLQAHGWHCADAGTARTKLAGRPRPRQASSIVRRVTTIQPGVPRSAAMRSSSGG